MLIKRIKWKPWIGNLWSKSLITVVGVIAVKNLTSIIIYEFHDIMSLSLTLGAFKFAFIFGHSWIVKADNWCLGSISPPPATHKLTVRLKKYVGARQWTLTKQFCSHGAATNSWITADIFSCLQIWASYNACSQVVCVGWRLLWIHREVVRALITSSYGLTTFSKQTLVQEPVTMPVLKLFVLDDDCLEYIEEYWEHW